MNLEESTNEETQAVTDEETQAVTDEENAARMLAEFRTGNTYQNASEKYQDYMSSAVTFICGGIIVFALLVLNDTGILHIVQKNSQTFVFANIMFALISAACMVIGVLSLRSALSKKKQIGSEAGKESEILSWLDGNVTREDIESSYNGDGLTEELKYFYRSAYIKQAILENFEALNLNEGFADMLSDQYIEQLFGSSSDAD